SGRPESRAHSRRRCFAASPDTPPPRGCADAGRAAAGSNLARLDELRGRSPSLACFESLRRSRGGTRSPRSPLQRGASRFFDVKPATRSWGEAQTTSSKFPAVSAYAPAACPAAFVWQGTPVLAWRADDP